MADENRLAIIVVTPERILFSGEATEAVLRTRDGDMTILAGHTPLVGTVEPGVIRVERPEGETVRVAAHGGFVQVDNEVEPGPADDGRAASAGARSACTSRVTLLVGVAELASEIDTARAQVALEAAQGHLAELAGSGRSTSGEPEEPDDEMVEAQASLRRAEVRLEATETPVGASA
ncbi:MAG: F0F1 ATP synthase subunit epsilon [Acidimicrobiales bacterium]